MAIAFVGRFIGCSISINLTMPADALSFFNTDVAGEIPLELLNLADLQVCYFGETNLTRGTIPPSCSFTEVPNWRESARR